MKKAVSVNKATVGGTSILRGRPSTTREEWETAREADAIDLNRLLAAGGEVDAYVVPLWSNDDIERSLAELRGFDEARVYLELDSVEGQDAAVAAVAASEWAGIAYSGDDVHRAAELLYASAGLDIPVYVEVPQALEALALAIGEDFSPREIEAVLRGENKTVPDAESLDQARDLLEDLRA